MIKISKLFDVNIFASTENLIYHKWREKSIHSLIRCLVAPIQDFYDRAFNNAKNVDDLLSYNFSKGSLEALLNNKLDPVLRRIYIEPQDRGTTLYEKTDVPDPLNGRLGTGGEQSSFTLLCETDTGTSNTYVFTVFVPTGTDYTLLGVQIMMKPYLSPYNNNFNIVEF